jgi:hypothetical protein
MYNNLRIRFHHNQVGMLIEASNDHGPWQTIELQKYTGFPVRSSGRGAITKVMSTARQEAAYLAFLTAKGIPFQVVKNEVRT